MESRLSGRKSRFFMDSLRECNQLLEYFNILCHRAFSGFGEQGSVFIDSSSSPVAS